MLFVVAVADAGYIGSRAHNELLLGLVDKPRGMIRSVGSLCTKKFSAVSHDICRSLERAVNFIACVGVRTTIERLWAGVCNVVPDGDISGASSLTSSTFVTTPTVRIDQK